MAKFKKKPVIIEAIKYTGNNADEIIKFTNGKAYIVSAVGSSADGEGYPQHYESLKIKTPEGDHTVSINDWVFKGESSVQGVHFWPVKPDYLIENYDRVENNIESYYVDEKKLIGNPDAKIWAEEFVKLCKSKPTIATDEGTMLGWFANAIMAGYDRAKRGKK